VVRHGVLRLTFADGTTGEVEVLDRMRGPVFECALTPAGFAAVSVDVAKAKCAFGNPLRDEFWRVPKCGVSC
jgi:hypothetical protein